MFDKIILAILVVFAHFHQSDSLRIPRYFKQCSRNDPRLNECIKRHGQEALATLVKGDRKYRIPVLNPLLLPELVINQGEGLRIKLKNVTINGFADTVIEKCNFNFRERKIEMSLSLPQMTVNSQYEMSGRILVLPVTGKGPSYLTLNGLRYTYKFGFDFVKKNNLEYLIPKKGKISYTVSGMKIKFDNLFNGDKLLGEETNNFLNANWKEVSKELGPGVLEAMAEIVHLILSNVSTLVPFNELFPEKL